MTHISGLVADVHERARHFRGCTTEQALVYSCEIVAAEHEPLRTVHSSGVAALVSDVCSQEDIDPPAVEFDRRRTRCAAWSDAGSHTIGFSSHEPRLDEILHEIAHLLSRSGDHDADFRAALVGLSRRHAGIRHAALLQSLFERTGLDR